MAIGYQHVRFGGGPDQRVRDGIYRSVLKGCEGEGILTLRVQQAS